MSLRHYLPVVVVFTFRCRCRWLSFSKLHLVPFYPNIHVLPICINTSSITPACLFPFRVDCKLLVSHSVSSLITIRHNVSGIHIAILNSYSLLMGCIQPRQTESFWWSRLLYGSYYIFWFEQITPSDHTNHVWRKTDCAHGVHAYCITALKVNGKIPETYENHLLTLDNERLQSVCITEGPEDVVYRFFSSEFFPETSRENAYSQILLADGCGFKQYISFSRIVSLFSVRSYRIHF